MIININNICNVLVIPGHVYESFRAAGTFCLKKDVPFLKKRVLVSPSHVCYVSGLPHTLFVVVEKRHAFKSKSVCFYKRTDIL